jgi:hypothetical protein
MPNKSIDTYAFGDKDLDVSNGLCVNHNDPDLWFAGEIDLLSTNTSVNANSPAAKAEVEKAIAALSVCKNCPAKDNCLQLGSQGTQIYYGIYGGTMAGERLVVAGMSIKNATNKNRIAFARKVRKAMKERGMSGDQAV